MAKLSIATAVSVVQDSIFNNQQEVIHEAVGYIYWANYGLGLPYHSMMMTLTC
jgi:hypothetical protein